MTAIELEESGAIHVLTMQGTGLWNPAFLEAFGRVLDQLEAKSGPRCLVLTGTGKSFSAGFDLEVLGAGGQAASELVTGGIALLGRLLASPVPSVAAIGGHAFGIGAMVAIACDFRVMRADRGFFCLPEIDLKMSLAPAMMALLQAKLSPAVLSEVLLTGRRVGGEEAAALGIVDASCAAGELLAQASSRVAPLADKDGPTYAALKRGLYRRPLEIFEAAS